MFPIKAELANGYHVFTDKKNNPILIIDTTCYNDFEVYIEDIEDFFEHPDETLCVDNLIFSFNNGQYYFIEA